MPRQAPDAASVTQGQRWTPQDIYGSLKLWLDATDYPTTGFVSGSVETWTDKAQRAGNLNANNVSGQRAALGTINGRRSLTGGGNAHFVSSSTVAVALPLVTVAVGTLSSGLSSGRFLSFVVSGPDYGGGGNTMLILQNGATNALASYYSGSFIAADTVTYDVPWIYTTLIDGSGNLSHFLNGAAGNTGTTAWTGGTGNFCMGTLTNAWDGGSEWAGQWGCVAVAQGNEGVAARQKLEGWAAWQYGLQDSLAASHPYRNTPPLKAR